MWIDWHQGRTETLTVSNRSLGPVAIAFSGVEAATLKKSVSYLGVLPPCTRATFTGHLINRATIPRVSALWVDGLLFRDSAGVLWKRTTSGYIVKTNDQRFSTDLLGLGAPLRRPPVGDAKLVAEESCGSS
jgi:hypothetical protein